MYKKIILFLCFVFCLTGCFGGGENEVSKNAAGLNDFNAGSFVMGIPANWEIVEDVQDVLPSPYTGEIELVSMSTESKKGVKNNLLVLSEKLDTFMTSSDFITASQVQSEKDFYSYNQNTVKNISFLDGISSILYVFQAQYNKDTPIYTFVQTARICNANEAFIMTITLPQNTRDTEIYEQLLKTFTCIDRNDDEI